MKAMGILTTVLIVIGGLNPIAALCEAGIPVSIQTLSGLEDLSRFSAFADAAMRGREQSPYVDWDQEET